MHTGEQEGLFLLFAPEYTFKRAFVYCVMDSWDSFLKELQASECAKLYGTNLVVGRGSLTPRVVFVGEAPGAEEDAQRLPFVGRSGQMLEQWIAACSLGPDDYYITNVVKTRPPENRDPTPDEVALCAPLLARQLALLRPHVIVAVGRFAMNYFYPKKKSILAESGKLHDGKIFVIPHPSYFLRNGGKGWEPYIEQLAAVLKSESRGESQTTLS
jgi:DNA polymerase